MLVSNRVKKADTVRLKAKQRAILSINLQTVQQEQKQTASN
jgi:hypothetical protein